MSEAQGRRQGPAQDPTRADGGQRLGGLVLAQAAVGPVDNRAYALVDAASGAWLLVDAAAEPERLLALLRGAGADLDPAAGCGLVVTTHRHPDHVGALAEVARATGAPTAAGADDADALPVPPDRRLVHGDRVRVGAVELEVVALRGHTPGSVALLLPGAAAGGAGGADHLLTGDSLFPGGPGRTTSPADFTSLVDDLQARVFDRLDDATVVHPGHGEPTTLGTERPQLPAWRARGW